MNFIEEIKGKLQKELDPKILEVIDESAMHGSSNSHFRVLVVSDQFEGMNSLQRHQKVHRVAGMDLIGKIHAFSQQTFTETEWKQSEGYRSSPPCHKKS